MYLNLNDYDQSCCIGEQLCRSLEEDRLAADDLLLNTTWNIVGVSYFQLVSSPALLIHLLTYSFIHSFIRSFVRSFIHSFIHTHPSIHLSMHPFIHLFRFAHFLQSFFNSFFSSTLSFTLSFTQLSFIFHFPYPSMSSRGLFYELSFLMLFHFLFIQFPFLSFVISHPDFHPLIF